MILDSLLAWDAPEDRGAGGAIDGEPSFDRVLLAVDDETDPAVTETAVSIANAFDASIHALSIVPMNASVDHWDVVVERREAAAEAALDGVTEIAGTVSVTKQLRYGDPAEEIGRYAEHNGIDLVVAGKPDRSGLRGFLAPKSVTESLQGSVSLPVLAVPAVGAPATNGHGHPAPSSRDAPVASDD